MELLETMLGQLPESIYFAIFLIATKRIKTKRILFLILMIIEYLLLKQLFEFNIWFQVSDCFMTFLTLKVLYREKAQVTDIFTFGIASIILIFSSMITYLLFKPNMLLVAISNRLLLMLFLVITFNKLYKIQNLYKSLWNRNDSIKKKMKSTTFRSLNIVVFNLMYYIINLGMTYAILIRK